MRYSVKLKKKSIHISKRGVEFRNTTKATTESISFARKGQFSITSHELTLTGDIQDTKSHPFQCHL